MQARFWGDPGHVWVTGSSIRSRLVRLALGGIRSRSLVSLGASVVPKPPSVHERRVAKGRRSVWRGGWCCDNCGMADHKLAEARLKTPPGGPGKPRKIKGHSRRLAPAAAMALSSTWLLKLEIGRLWASERAFKRVWARPLRRTRGGNNFALWPDRKRFPNDALQACRGRPAQGQRAEVHPELLRHVARHRLCCGVRAVRRCGEPPCFVRAPAEPVAPAHGTDASAPAQRRARRGRDDSADGGE